MLLITAGLVNDDLEPVILGLDFLRRQEFGTCGEDGRLDDGVLGPVNAEEIT